MVFTTAVPIAIYPIAITEFFGNIDKERQKTWITLIKEESDGRLMTTTKVLDLVEVATNGLRLRNEGKDVKDVSEEDLDIEFGRYTQYTRELLIKGEDVHKLSARDIQNPL